QIVTGPPAEPAIPARMRLVSTAEAAQPDGTRRMPDLGGKTLRQALEALEPLRVEVRLAGQGRVFRQVPAAGDPLEPGAVVGITGTNGKTTTSYLIEALLRARGLATGVIGTIQYVLGDETRPANQTTPEALDLQAMLAHMRDRGVRGVAMEVSSHALALARAEGLAFDVAVFTNLTQDHLDFHGTLERYRLAKRRLFELLAESPKPTRTAG